MNFATTLAMQLYLWICFISLVLYLPRISYYFFAFKKQKKITNDKKNKIAVIIPARDESLVIADCLNSLAAQTYGADFFDIHIAVADEEDATVKIAAAYDCTYVTVVSDQKCKGEALDGVLKKILAQEPNKYQAFLIVDADNLAAPNLLEEMNNALASGKQIICGKKHIKNWQSNRRKSRSFISNCTALTYIQVDELGNLARNAFGASIAMIGTGMLVRADVIKENNGWPYRSLTEDYEMTADATLKGWSSMYYSHAEVYTEEAVHKKIAFKRRLRWIKGYTQCMRKYKRKIAKKKFPKGKKWQKIGFLFGRYPAYVFFAASAIATVCGLVALGFANFNQSVSFTAALHLTFIPLLLVYGIFTLYTILTLVVDWKNIKIPLLEKLILVFFNPIYMLGYFRIFILALFTSYDTFKWETTQRIPFDVE